MSVDINNSILTEKALNYAKLSSLAYANWVKIGKNRKRGQVYSWLMLK